VVRVLDVLPPALPHALSITFAFVATHNHSSSTAAARSSTEARRHQAPRGANEEDHLALLGLLNSSTACFWMKQVSYPKERVDWRQERGEDAIRGQSIRIRGTGLEPFPSARARTWRRSLSLLGNSIALQAEATSLDVCTWWRSKMPSERGMRLADIEQAEERWDALRRRMVALQEELDWACYRAYG